VIVSAFDAKLARQMRTGEFFAFQGHPGLRLVATKRNRTWTYRYSSPATKRQKQMRLGHWPTLSFALAVDAWEKARSARSKGTDVAAHRRQERQAEQADAERKARRLEQTCGRVVEQYLAELVEPRRKAKGAAEVRRMLTRAISPVEDLPAPDLSTSRAHELVMAVATSAPRVAAMTRQELRAARAHAISVERIPISNPFAGKTVGGRLTAVARDRALSSREAGTLLRWMAEPKSYSRTVRDALELTLRTGLRSGEVCEIHTRELEVRGDVLWLNIPGARMKEGRPHSCPIVGRAASIVQARTPADGGYLFPARRVDVPIQQKVLGVEVYAHAGRSQAKPYVGKRVCPVSDWTPRDLRRTARTLLGDLGCPFEVGEAILAHALPGVAQVYNRSLYEAARVEWLGRLNDHLDALAAGDLLSR
jgi:integrase